MSYLTGTQGEKVQQCPRCSECPPQLLTQCCGCKRPQHCVRSCGGHSEHLGHCCTFSPWVPVKYDMIHVQVPGNPMWSKPGNSMWSELLEVTARCVAR